ncbi:MAG TPA: 30S ribosomal protein S3, partial [Burkholderiaceae bacterium]|nr:30S ribosomal protein S3 [Burkholderiaceae bacterium]
AKTTYGVIGVKVWVYRGDRLANGEAPVIRGEERTEDDRRRRGPRNDRPGERRGPRGPGGPGAGRGGPRPDGAPADGAKRVVRAAAPGAAAKGE